MIALAGLNAVGIEVAVEELDPFWAGTLRFSSAGLIFAALMPVLRVPIPRGGALVGALVYGVIIFGIGFGCAFWGLQEAPSGTGQTLIALVPLMTLFLAVAHRLERFRLRALLGALALAEGGVLVKLIPHAHPVATNAVGMLGGSVLLAALSVFTLAKPGCCPGMAEPGLR